MRTGSQLFWYIWGARCCPPYQGPPHLWPTLQRLSCLVARRKIHFLQLRPSGTLDFLYRQNADGSGSKEKLLGTPGVNETPFSVSPDGRYIAYLRSDPKSNTGLDIWALPLFGDQKPFPVVATKFQDFTPEPLTLITNWPADLKP